MVRRLPDHARLPPLRCVRTPNIALYWTAPATHLLTHDTITTGVVLILFYQSSSMLTKFRAEVKARFEEDHALLSPSSTSTQQQTQQGKHGKGNGKDGGGVGPSQARSATQVRRRNACSDIV